MKRKNLSLVFAAVLAVLAIVLTSGCMGNQKEVKEGVTVNKTTDHESVIKAIKDNIKKEYDWKIIELKAAALKTAKENEGLIENETEEILKNLTKEDLLNNADEYGLGKDEISYIKGMTADEFEKFKEKTLKPYVTKAVKENVMNGVKESVNEYNYTILEIKPKDEIKDIDVYLDAYSISDKVKKDVKKKINNGSYVVIIEMNIGTKFNTAEVCDKKGKIIK